MPLDRQIIVSYLTGMDRKFIARSPVSRRQHRDEVVQPNIKELSETVSAQEVLMPVEFPSTTREMFWQPTSQRRAYKYVSK